MLPLKIRWRRSWLKLKVIGRKLIGKFPTITDDSKAARKINQVLEKEKNRLIHQYDKELADFKKEYKSQAAYDKENGYASIRCADAGKDRSGCYEGSGESRTCADYRNLKLMLLP